MEAELNVEAPISATLSLRDAVCRQWDAAIVGAGPAGAVAASVLAKYGWSVLLIDKASFPRGKVCGCCLGGAALDALDRIGMLGQVLPHGAPLSQLDLRYGPARAELAAHGLSISRATLDAILIREAIRAGAEFLPSTVGEMGAATPPSLRLRGPGDKALVNAAANYILACGGLAGTGLHDNAARVERGSRIGVSATLDPPFDVGTIRMACSADGYVGTVRLEDARQHVAAALDPAFVRRCGGPGKAVVAVLRHAGVDPPLELASACWRGTPGLTRRRLWLYRAGVLVLGDAAGYVEPFTGEGIGWAINSALAVTSLLLEGRPEAWPACHARLIARRQRVCRAVAALLRRPRLATLAVRAMALFPHAAAPAVVRIQRPILGSLP